MEIICLDTNILIEILKGNAKTKKQLLEMGGSFVISSITVMELFYGARNKQEILTLDKFIKHFEIIDLTPTISKHATFLVKTFSKSHTLDIPDALIAATCIVNNISLFTYNLKDFQYLPNLSIYLPNK